MQRVLLLTLALLLTPLSWAEEEMTIYSELTFLSSAPGAEAALEAALLEGPAAAGQAQANAGELFAWALYRVLYHHGDYTHVMIRQAIRREGLSPLLQPSTDDELRGLARREGRVVYALEQFHTNLALRDRPFLTAVFLQSQDGEGTQAVLANRFGPALKTLIADEAGPAAYSQFRRRLPGAGGDHDRVMVLQYPSFEALWSSAPAEAAFKAHDDTLAAAEAALGDVATIVRSEQWQLVKVLTRQAPN
jgi:hypothetical protein